VVVSGIGAIVEAIADLLVGFGIAPRSTRPTDDRKRRRDYEAWREKHGSKWDKK
jgi:hypothetical protein